MEDRVGGVELLVSDAAPKVKDFLESSCVGSEASLVLPTGAPKVKELFEPVDSFSENAADGVVSFGRADLSSFLASSGCLGAPKLNDGVSLLSVDFLAPNVNEGVAFLSSALVLPLAAPNEKEGVATLFSAEVSDFESPKLKDGPCFVTPSVEVTSGLSAWSAVDDFSGAFPKLKAGFVFDPVPKENAGTVSLFPFSF